MGLPHRGYSISAGSDADTENEGVMSPEHAMRLWGRGVKSGRSSCLSSRSNSALTLTDTEHENKSDSENGKFLHMPIYKSMFYLLFWLTLDNFKSLKEWPWIFFFFSSSSQKSQYSVSVLTNASFTCNVLAVILKEFNHKKRLALFYLRPCHLLPFGEQLSKWW